MQSFLKILSLSVLASFALLAQTVNIKGVVLDDYTDLPVEGVNVVISESQSTLMTDRFGNFEFSFNSESSIQLIFLRIGYKSYRLNIDQSINLPLEIRLTQSKITLGEVTVTSTRYSKLEKDVALPLEVIEIRKKSCHQCSRYSF